MKSLIFALVGCGLGCLDGFAQQDIVWSNMDQTYVIAGKDSICSDTNAAAWGYAGAFSFNRLPDASDGYVQLTYQGSGEIAFGLSNEDVDLDVKTIDYAFELSASSVKVWAGGFVQTTLSAPRGGDVYNIDKSSGTIDFKVNSVSVHTESAPAADLYVDASFYDEDCFGGWETDIEGPVIPFVRPRRLPSAAFYRTYEKNLQLEFVEEYKLDAEKDFIYNVYDSGHDIVASVSESGTASPASSPTILVERGENYLILSFGQLGLSTGEVYLLEVMNRKFEKSYLRFVFEADMPN